VACDTEKEKDFGAMKSDDISDDSVEWDESREKVFGQKELDEMSDLSDTDDDDDDDDKDDDDDDDDDDEDDDDVPLDKLFGVYQKPKTNIK
jgi:hypothetical protein